MKKHIEVVAAIIYDNGAILATRRNYGEFENQWEFPGGKIEKGEAPEVALVREIKEELSVDIEIDSFLDTVEYEYDDFYLTMHCYNTHIIAGELSLSVHNAMQWLLVENLDRVTWLPADIAVVSILKEKYSN